MPDIVRQLTKAGTDAFRDYIQASRRGEPASPPYHLLYQSPYSESLSRHVEIERNRFYTKYEAATYLAGVFADLDQSETSYNGGLWSWISLYYLEELLEAKISRKKQLNAPDNYVLEVEQGDLKWGEYCHHLLATPFYLYRSHGEEARMLLAGPVGSRMALTSEIVARMRFARSREFIRLVNRLYSDGRGNMKRGAASGEKRAGSVHRLIRIFQQLELTYDVFDMNCEKMIKLLPPEFDEWLDSEREV